MSVPKGERGETKLAVIDHAEKLAAYTMNITSNEKHFPKHYRWCLSGPIVTKVTNIVVLVSEANGIYPITKDDYRFRRSLQNQALAEMEGMLALISIAKSSYKVDLDNLSAWLEMATYERTILKKWKESDYLQFGGLPT